METKETRIDKYLWAVRLFRSRSSASEACRKSRVIIGGNPVKPSHSVTTGDTIIIRKPPVTYTYLVKGLTENRVGAKLVSLYLTDLTPDEEKNRIRPESGAFSGHRPRGTGRPTKRERRDLENFLD
ncbi:MAG TPA: S4 domain-containing protein [Bacteroidales bacterium]|nr:S4 domain-containing protein [Bacteroidales bacterium]